MEEVIRRESEKSTSLYQRMVTKLLENFPKGKLSLTFPNGECRVYGNGQGTHASMQILNSDFFRKVILYADVGLGESYVDGDWQSPDLTAFVRWAIENIESSGMMSGSRQKVIFANLLSLANRASHLFHRNTVEGSAKNIQYHYDLSNEFYSLMLDPSMTYSCGIFQSADTTLEEAQIEKYRQICKDLDLNERDHVLEIGCGWGGFAEFAAKNYGCKITGLTISNKQYEFAVERMKRAGLSHLVSIEHKDYRHMKGRFSKIVSIEMIEAVGHEFLPVYFKQLGDLLTDDGLVLLQVITSPDSRYDQFRKGVDWIQKHIFPGSLLPSIGEMNRVANQTTTLQLFSLRDIGLHYPRTLRLWREAFEKNWDSIRALGFDESFYRKWRYYLCYCEAAFATRNISDVQLTLIKPNNSAVHKLGFES